MKENLNRQLLNRYMENECLLPEMMYSTLKSDPDQIIIIRKGETGYYNTDIRGRKTVDEFNTERGIDPEMEEAMRLKSMFGWNE